MRYFPTKEMMKQADKNTIEIYGIPSMVLMERAALETVSVMEQKKLPLKNTLIVCGSGNNGGDGFAVARLLFLKGYRVSVYFAGKEESLTQETRNQKDIAQKYGVPFVNLLLANEYSVIVDAIFGIGVSRNIDGSYYELLEKLNKIDAVKVAIDIPTGVCATSGKVLGAAFRADYTITYAYAKLGMIMFPGYEYCGSISVVEIGITEQSFSNVKAVPYTLTTSDLKEILPLRKQNSHKGTYGKVLICAGSKGMAGAAFLSGKACYHAGAGMVKILTCEENRLILQTLLPEAMVVSYEENTPVEALVLQEVKWADVALIGCGLGQSLVSRVILETLLLKTEIPCIVDADGLNLLAKNMSLLSDRRHVILTPHMMELARILDLEIEELFENLIQKCCELVQRYPVTCVAKNARTVVTQSEHPVFVNTAGNSAMAKAGSGDILGGIIAGLRAQGASDYDSARGGVYLHALSGDKAKEQKGGYSTSVLDLIDNLSTVLVECEREMADETV